MDGQPSDGMEVFSSTEILDKSISDKEVLGKAIGAGKENWTQRFDRAWKFIDGEIAREIIDHLSPKPVDKG
jgi:hypothetical protein